MKNSGTKAKKVARMAKVLFTSTEERFDDWFLEKKILFIFSDFICKKLSKIGSKLFD